MNGNLIKNPQNPYYILVVDDDEVIVELVTRLLSQFENCRPISASTYFEGESKLSQWPFELVLLDWNLPDGEGLDLCRKIKASNILEGPLVVMITGYSDSARKIHALDAGADDFLGKPIDFAEFRAKVRSYLRIKDLQNTINEDRKKLAELNTELEREILELTRLLTQIMEHRLPKAAVRGKSVSEVSRWIAEHLSMTPEEVKDVEMAGLLHEVGKLALPDPILFTAMEDMDEDQWIQFRQHPILGDLSLSQVTRLKNAAGVIRHQLENFDGTGTPEHWQCTEIPLGSRILRVVTDFYDLCQSDPGSTASILERLERQSGSWYDPQVLQQLRLHIQLKGMPQPDRIYPVSLMQLHPGMVLAQDVVTISGIKLLSQNVCLDRRMIQHLHNFHETDPVVNGSVYVYHS